MTKTRLVALGAALFTVVATPAAAAPVAATPKATAKAQIVKPITFAAVTNLNFGTVVLGTLTAPSTVTIDKTAVAVSVCGANLTCSGASNAAKYNVRSTPAQQLTVRSAVSNLLLVGSVASPVPSVVFTPDAPAIIAAGNASSAGYDFYVGGKIDVTTTTLEGVYLGDMDVTVDYN